MESENIRLDHRVIFELIEFNSKVLDLGCGNGDLMYLLTRKKKVRVQGIEVDDAAIAKCVKKGLSVFHSDLETGLIEFPDRSFDYVILNQSLQEVRKAEYIIDESLRVAGRVIVGIPNFACLRSRLALFFRGRAPVTLSLPCHWYNTPNLRFLSIRDFWDFIREKGYKAMAARYLQGDREIRLLPNLRAWNAIFMIAKCESQPQSGLRSAAS